MKNKYDLLWSHSLHFQCLQINLPAISLKHIMIIQFTGILHWLLVTVNQPMQSVVVFMSNRIAVIGFPVKFLQQVALIFKITLYKHNILLISPASHFYNPFFSQANRQFQNKHESVYRHMTEYCLHYSNQ